jgi:hypothetical protein
MKLKMLMATVAAAGLAYVPALSAQTAQSTPPQQQEQQQNRNSSSTITVTGCLQRNSDMMGGMMSGKATGTSGTNAKANRHADMFVLTNARLGTATNTVGNNGRTALGEAGSGQSAGTSGTEGGEMTGASPATNMYLLEGHRNELATKSGNEVQITGRLASPHAQARSTSSDTKMMAPKGSMPHGPRLRVQSVKVIAQTCVAR